MKAISKDQITNFNVNGVKKIQVSSLFMNLIIGEGSNNTKFFVEESSMKNIVGKLLNTTKVIFF